MGYGKEDDDATSGHRPPLEQTGSDIADAVRVLVKAKTEATQLIVAAAKGDIPSTIEILSREFTK